MERYEKYKDSGVEWIGEIPAGWEVKKIKHTGEIVLGKMLTNNDKGNYKKRKYLRAANIEWLGVNANDIKEMWFSDDELERLRLHENDLLVSEGGEVGRTCIWKNEIDKCYIQNSVHKVTFNKYSNPKYFLFQFYILGQKGVFDSIVNRISIAHLTGEKIKEINFICPPLSDQTIIANYLDRKTAQIDELIAQKERLIELYEEEKTAIINQAVTKGIDPDARLKDSGIEWLGDIPEGWEVKKLKYVAKAVITGKTPSSSNAGFYNGDINWFAPGDFNYGLELTDSKKKITNYAVEISGMKVFPQNSILLVGIGATVGKMGIAKCSGTSNQQINAIIVKEDQLNPYFALYFLLSVKTAIIRLANAATLPIFNQTQTKEFEIFIPEIVDQLAIVHHIETETARINAKIAKTKKIIELQKEYRTALISEVVTGKIKIPQETKS